MGTWPITRKAFEGTYYCAYNLPSFDDILRVLMENKTNRVVLYVAEEDVEKANAMLDLLRRMDLHSSMSLSRRAISLMRAPMNSEEGTKEFESLVEQHLDSIVIDTVTHSVSYRAYNGGVLLGEGVNGLDEEERRMIERESRMDPPDDD